LKAALAVARLVEQLPVADFNPFGRSGFEPTRLMTTTTVFRCCFASLLRHSARAFLCLTFLLSPALTALRAADAATGAIEGRVFNPATGEYLEKARVSIEGTGLETLTDELGQYYFGNVPAGSAQVKVFYTGLTPQTAAVAVSAGQVAQRDFELARFGTPPAGAKDDTVKLSKFVVSSSREMDGAAIAINEKRFAADIRNVIAADEFGPTADGNVGEILKTVPGVALDYVGGAAMNISLNGVPTGYVPVTMNGFPLASTTATAPTARDVELVNVATNNLSRIEVLHSPTPEMPGNALAGSVNMVPRNAFDRAKPQLMTNIYALMRDDMRSLTRSAGPGPTPNYKVHPGIDFSYIAPVTKNFGFTLSGGTSQQYQPTYFVQAEWRGVGAPTTVAANGTTGFPATTPDKPYMTSYLIRDQPRQSRRSSAGITLDYRFSRYDRVSLSLQAAKFDAQYNERDLTFAINRVQPGNFDLTFTHGDRGAGGGTVTLATANDRDRRNQNLTPSLTYHHDGPIWKAEAGIGTSMSESKIYQMGKGQFGGTVTNRTNAQISFDDIFYLRPGRITVTDGLTGAPIDPYSLATYTVTQGTGNMYSANNVLGAGPGEGLASYTADIQRNAYANVKRDFQWGLPFTLKGGLDARQSVRDYRGGAMTYTYVGPDGRAGSGDENALPFLDPGYSDRDGIYGFPKTQRLSGWKLWDYTKSNPQAFTTNDNNAYRAAVQLSTWAQETISSAYVRADTALLRNRLKLTFGVRGEQTNIDGYGPLNDPTRNYQRNASGAVIDGNPNLAGVQTVPIVPTTDLLGVSKLTFIDRGEHTKKEYLRWFPSINASYNLRENLVARAAYYTSIGRPLYSQYTGSGGTGLVLPDETQAPSPNNRIQVNNVGIKPWSAETYKVSLEYYFERVGLLSIGAFHRNFENFFGSTVIHATPEFLSLYNLDPSTYGGFDVATQFNQPGKVRMEGYDVAYKQALTFLPEWARGVQVFANGAAQRGTGDLVDNFSGFIPKTASWGISLNRPRYSLKVNWNYKSKHRRGAITGTGIPPGTYQWGSKRLFIDIIGEYTLSKNFALFGNIRNLNDTPEDFVRDGPGIPDVAKFRQRDRYGALWIFGLKGTF
jgi:iron complex outermembrane recepter protein